MLALLAQSVVPGLALGARPEGSGPRTLLICTADGIKWIEVDEGTEEPAPEVQHTCPCGVLCAACVPGHCARADEQVVYAELLDFERPDHDGPPIRARAPPRHQVRAPPSLG